MWVYHCPPCWGPISSHKGHKSTYTEQWASKHNGYTILYAFEAFGRHSGWSGCCCHMKSMSIPKIWEKQPTSFIFQGKKGFWGSKTDTDLHELGVFGLKTWLFIILNQLPYHFHHKKFLAWWPITCGLEAPLFRLFRARPLACRIRLSGRRRSWASKICSMKSWNHRLFIDYAYVWGHRPATSRYQPAKLVRAIKYTLPLDNGGGVIPAGIHTHTHTHIYIYIYIYIYRERERG